MDGLSGMVDSAMVYKRLRELETDAALVKERHDNLVARIDSLEENKIDPMAKQVDELYTTLIRGKGFFGGMLFIVSVVWALIGAFGLAIWKFFTE